MLCIKSLYLSKLNTKVIWLHVSTSAAGSLKSEMWGRFSLLQATIFRFQVMPCTLM